MIVLDTHAWVWWVSDPAQLSSRAHAAIDEAVASAGVYVSAISVWEVALLVGKGRLKLTMEPAEWVRRSQALPFLTFVAIDPALALEAVRLDGAFHEDPADRFILATALSLEAPVVTKDRRIHDFAAVQAIW